MRLRLLSSKAPAAALHRWADQLRDAGLADLTVESVGGVDVAHRVGAGEEVDVVVVAADAAEELAAGGLVLADSRRALVMTETVAAVRAGQVPPEWGSLAALQKSVRAAGRIGLSTGPSGRAVRRLLTSLGLLGGPTGTQRAAADESVVEVVVAPPGTGVAALLLSGEVALAFQQRTELECVAGVEIIGGLPAGHEVTTTFVGAVTRACRRPDEARRALDHLYALTTRSPEGIPA